MITCIGSRLLQFYLSRLMTHDHSQQRKKKKKQKQMTFAPTI